MGFETMVSVYTEQFYLPWSGQWLVPQQPKRLKTPFVVQMW